MAVRNPRSQTTEWIASRHPDTILYGIIITGAVMSATAGHETSARRIVATTLFVLGIYWLADLYVRAFAEQFHGARRALSERIPAAARHESGVLLGGVPALGTFTVMTAVGVAPGFAADVALWLTVAELGGLGYLSARRAGATAREALVEAAFAALLGVLMVVSKTLLH